MGTILFLLFAIIPAVLANLLAKWARGGRREFFGMLMMALGSSTAWLGYQLGFIVSEEVQGSQVVMTTFPAAGVLGMVVGIGIGLWGLYVWSSKATPESEGGKQGTKTEPKAQAATDAEAKPKRKIS